MRYIDDKATFTKNYFDAPYDLINCKLSEIDWSNLFHSCDVNNCVDKFYDKIFSIINMHVPDKVIRKYNFPKWVSRNTRMLIWRKKIAHRQYRRSGNDGDYVSFTRLRADSKTALGADRLVEDRKVEEYLLTNPTSFWNRANGFRKRNSYQHP